MKFQNRLDDEFFKGLNIFEVHIIIITTICIHIIYLWEDFKNI